MGLTGTYPATMTKYLGLVCLVAVALAVSENLQSVSALPTPARPSSPMTESLSTACNNPWDGENWTSNSFKLYRKVCREEQLCFNRTRNTTRPVCYTLKIPGFSNYRYCETKTEVIRDPYCVQRTVCDRQANTAGAGRSRLATDEVTVISHSNGSDKSDQYENNTDQIWNIQTTTPFQNIYLYIDTLEVEDSVDCSKDYLLIQDSPCSNTHRLCGLKSDVSYTSTTGQLQIKFSTDSDTTSRGFRALYWIADGREVTADYGKQILMRRAGSSP